MNGATLSRRMLPLQLLMRAPSASSRLLLACSLALGLSILYQVYFYDFQDGQLSGGERPRLVLKIVATLLFLFSVRRYFSRAALALNFPLKAPLLFVAGSILVVYPYLDASYSQALNLFFFLPILAIDWNKPGGAQLYRTIWAIITAIVVVQLALDPVCKVYFQAIWSNAATIGGMGNPNVFGVFLIAGGLASALLFTRFRFLSSILFLATALTGSLAAAAVGFGCLAVQLALLWSRAPVRALIVVGAAIAVLSLSTLFLEFITDSPSIGHAFSKLMAVHDALSSGTKGDTESISVRLQYLRDGLDMLADSPAAVILGHPRGTPMYNGDGLWTSLLVTYGLPVTLCFLTVNLLVVYRAVSSGVRDLLFSGCVVAFMLVFFVTNRILDYWPAPLVYLLAFSHLTISQVRRSRAGAVGAVKQA
jgi:hypothetical protein